MFFTELIDTDRLMVAKGQGWTKWVKGVKRYILPVIKNIKHRDVIILKRNNGF